MSGLPSPDEAEVSANAAFESLLWSMSRPGQVRELPEPGEYTIIQALIDRECKVYTDDADLVTILGRTGAQLSAIAEADYVFLGNLNTLQPLSSIKTGSDLYPDTAATVILRVSLGEGGPYRLTGPGVDEHENLSVSGLPEGFWQQRNTLMRYPMGFDLILIDYNKVVSVPRSTSVERR